MPLLAIEAAVASNPPILLKPEPDEDENQQEAAREAPKWL